MGIIQLNAAYVSTITELNAAISAVVPHINVISALTMSASIVVPSTCVLTIYPGCPITTTGYTLTINKFATGRWNCFSGSGTVTLPSHSTPEVYPEWWGTTGADLQKAIVAGKYAGIPVNIGDYGTIWTLTDPIQLYSYSYMVGKAAIDYSSATTYGSYKTGLYAVGTDGTSSLLQADVNEGDYAAAVVSASAFSVDDWVRLQSSDNQINSGTARISIDSSAAVNVGGGVVGIPVASHGYDIATAQRYVSITGTTNYNGFYEIQLTSTTNQINILATYVAEVFSSTCQIQSVYLTNMGEYKRIRAKSGNVLFFTTPILENYTVANSAKITAVSWVHDIIIDGPTIIGPDSETGNDMGIRIINARDVEVKNCSFTGTEFYSLSFEQCLNFSAHGNKFDGVQYVSTSGSIFYAIAVIDCSMYGRIYNNFCQKERHLAVTSSFSSTAGRYGQPYFIDIFHNHAIDSMGGDISHASYLYEQHGQGRFINVYNNGAEGAYAGANIDNGKDVKISGNTFRGNMVGGVLFGDTWSNLLQNIIISDNTISLLNHGSPMSIDSSAAVNVGGGVVGIPVTGHGFGTSGNVKITGTTNYNGYYAIQATSTANQVNILETYSAETFSESSLILKVISVPHGIKYGGPTTGVTWDNVSISNNNFSLCNTPSSSAIYLTSNSDSKRGCLISGNKMATGESGQEADSGYGIVLSDNVDWTVKGNYITNMRQGIYSECDVVASHPNIIVDNIIEYDVQATAGYAIYLKGDKQICQRNIVKRGSYPVRIETSTNDVILTNNVWYDCAHAISDGGTGTVDRDNDTL